MAIHLGGIDVKGGDNLEQGSRPKKYAKRRAEFPTPTSATDAWWPDSRRPRSVLPEYDSRPARRCLVAHVHGSRNCSGVTSASTAAGAEDVARARESQVRGYAKESAHYDSSDTVFLPTVRVLVVS